MITPPEHLTAAHGASKAFFAVAVVYLAACLVWAVRGRRRRGWLPLVLIVGGVIAALQESLIDRMILLWYPHDAPAIAFNAMGVPQPLYMILIYGGFVGCGSYASYDVLRRDPSGRKLWGVFGAILAMDMAFEVPATAGHVFYYYGPQPFQVVSQGWPLWVGFLAAGAPVVSGWALYHLVPRFGGPASWLLALVPPTAWATVYFAAGWPTFITINSSATAVLRYGGAVATMGLSIAFVATIVATSGRRDARAVSPAVVDLERGAVAGAA